MKDRRTRRHGSFLSLSLLRESILSNWLSFLVTGFGNFLIVIVVVLILSTLDLNATQQSLTQLFGNASTLSLVSQGGIAYYLSYGGGITLYEEGDAFLGSGQESLLSGIDTAFSVQVRLEEDETLQNVVRGLVFTPYDLAYENATGTDSQKHEEAKKAFEDNRLIDLLVSFFPSLSGIPSTLFTQGVDALLDTYHDAKQQQGDSLDVSAVTWDSVGRFAKKILVDDLHATEEDANSFVLFLDESLERYRTNPEDIHTISKELILSFVQAAVPTSMRQPALSFASALLKARDDDPEAFDGNVGKTGALGYRDQVLVDQIVALLSSLTEEQTFYAFLPSFSVPCLTDDLGRPYALEDGSIVLLSSYQPERQIPVASGMETESTLVEKMHKEEITGVPYTPEEIEAAKAEAEQQNALLEGDLRTFLADYATKEASGEDPGYFEWSGPFLGSVDDDRLIPVVVDKVTALGEENIVQVFGVESLSDITKDKVGIDGQSILDLVENQVLGSIASFKDHLAEDSAIEGRSLEEAILSSLVKASRNILDNLPSKVAESFEELSEMNMYGVLIGIVFFALAGLLLPMVYTILTANDLLAQKVENGSLAFTMASPISRGEVVRTKAFFLVFAEVGMALLLLVGSLAARAIGIAIGGEDFLKSLPVDMLLKFVLGNFSVMFAVSGICFLASAVFNKVKFALGIGGGITIFFLVAAILGLFGGPAMPSTIRIDSMNFFNNLTIVSLYDASAAMSGSPVYFYKLLGLYGIGLLSYLASGIVFRHKDLPL